MSQSSKVLHVLVEVRSLPEREGKEARHAEAVDHTAPLRQEVQTQPGIVPGGVPEAKSASERGHTGNSCSPSRVPPTTCQHQKSGSSSTVHRQSLLDDRIGRLFAAVLSPSSNGGSAPMLNSSEHESSYGRGRQSSPVRTDMPAGGEGRRSVVTFSYIEKASVRKVESPRSGPRQAAVAFSADSPCLRRSAEGSPLASTARFCKRMSAPMHLYSPDSSCHSSPALSLRGQAPQRVDPSLCSVARGLAHQAEEFGSPQLKRRVPDGPYELHHTQPRCQSWAGSPAPARSSNTIPYGCPREPEWLKPPCDLPRNPTMTQPSSATLPTFRANRSPEAQIPEQYPGADGKSGKENRFARRVSLPPGDSFGSCGKGMNQLSGPKTASPANSPQTAHRLAMEVARISAVFNEARRSSLPLSQEGMFVPGSPRLGNLPQGCQCSSSQDRGSPSNRCTTMNIPVPHIPAPDIGLPAGTGGYHTFPVQSTDSAAREGVPGGSPALPSRLHRFCLSPAELASPMKDPRLQRATLQVTDTPTLHRHKPPQYTGLGENWSPSLEYEQGARDSPEPAVRLYVGQRGVEPDAEAPVSWTSRQQWGGMAGMECESLREGQQADRRVAGPFPVLQKEAELRTREALLLGPVTLDHPQAQDQWDEQRSGLVPGHWNVSLKPEEDQQPEEEGYLNGRGDRDSTSPESTLSSQRSYEMGQAASGIQSDSGLSSMGPSLRSQKIARAKWEFLFGKPSGDNTSTGSKDASTAPPSGTSSESPTPTPPNSLPLEVQRSASHEVQHVELELVTPPPMAAGASPKTGIIRRTIKYSETDLDAVPLRCYRETDIDEVLADQDEADSAFGSNRSVPGTPGTSGTGSSPLGGGTYERTDGEEEEEEEEEEEKGHGDVVSWASERRHGDRKRHRGFQDEGDVHSLLMKRPLDGFLHCHSALKSPILVTGPRLTSEDTFSRHFESIMESHRAKGTSYCSLDSVDLLTSSGQSVFTFDLPTLTPEVQGQTYQSAREIVGLSFAPWPAGRPPVPRRTPSLRWTRTPPVPRPVRG
ncbi:hypothetical protein AGOR_G00202320 [Albula goreensis]|uniref:Uncharacterized protein n=1 Tax=Albula goreensis TaxID=1534307 RepID=A0A8T3CXB0_9TELE|nr:hypothetical protein AGOR_G00202320 [Albula goreensis]